MKISLNEHQTEDLRKFFAEVDKDNNGKIDQEELRELLETIWGKDMNIDITSAVQSTFNKCDLNHDGFITFEEFLTLAH
ncbi:EF-hand domain-containing protein [Crocosphaera sp. UHCC 0190]|uniref:EF-hand domain-containing protein n=1 Tax=Crocosphaera sp. UHCC 0190 TaxID=3110246 RepID=UPI002B1EB130|nr:EF-hand domain-containing protein [Crocosphaera sp. UHCC 0190]MEA5512238.1 EF-hand domain-containing protein [Crocosphaera sp. UHCC 0190]